MATRAFEYLVYVGTCCIYISVDEKSFENKLCTAFWHNTSGSKHTERSNITLWNTMDTREHILLKTFLIWNEATHFVNNKIHIGIVKRKTESVYTLWRLRKTNASTRGSHKQTSQCLFMWVFIIDSMCALFAMTNASQLLDILLFRELSESNMIFCPHIPMVYFFIHVQAGNQSNMKVYVAYKRDVRVL